MKVHTNSMRFNFNTNFFCLNCSANWVNSKRHIHIFFQQNIIFRIVHFVREIRKKNTHTEAYCTQSTAKRRIVLLFVPKRKRKVLWTLFSFPFNSNLHLKFNALSLRSFSLSCSRVWLILYFIPLHFLLQSSLLDYPQSFWYAFKCLGVFSNR